MKFGSIISVILVISIGFISYKLYDLIRPLTAPTFKPNRWWGAGPPRVREIAVLDFAIHCDTERIDKLKKQLGKPLKLHEPLEDADETEYGINISKFKKLMEFWHKKYLKKWFTREKIFNILPNYYTKIQGIHMHFIYKKANRELAANKTIVPLLLLHGWPGSIKEFYDFIPLLTTPSNQSDYVFDVVAPCLPGFCWSGAAAKQNFGVAEMSVVLHNLMLRLNIEKYYIQGGDWGSILGSTIATIFPDNILGYHSNMCVSSTPLSMIKLFIANLYPSWFIDEKYIDFVFPIKEKLTTFLQESGYFHLQATKPDTIGAVLDSSPIALAAYHYEKFQKYFPTISDENFLDNIMIYYTTNTSTSSARLYAEAMSQHQLNHELARVPTPVPTGCARFKNDLLHYLDWQLIDKYPNLVHSTWYETGGHFAAMEVPDILYMDLIDFIGKVHREETETEIKTE